MEKTWQKFKCFHEKKSSASRTSPVFENVTCEKLSAFFNISGHLKCLKYLVSMLKTIHLGESWFSWATLFSPDVQPQQQAVSRQLASVRCRSLRRASKSVVLQHTCRRNWWPWNNWRMEPYPSRRPLAARYTTSPTNGRFSPTSPR